MRRQKVEYHTSLMLNFIKCNYVKLFKQQGMNTLLKSKDTLHKIEKCPNSDRDIQCD